MLPPGEGSTHPRRIARDLAAALGPGFEVMAELARGGFARVFTVHDATLDRLLAAKVITPELTFSEVAMERFRREAAMVSRLVHPSIVQVLFVVQAGESPCIVMPFISGESLHQRIAREGAMPLAVAAGIVQDVAAALDFAHGAGIVHRDVKPDNILLESATGRALLADFGIARSGDQTGRLTTTGQVLGTPMYIAPEQAAGERDLDARTDVYSLGVVAFEMIAGVPPYTSPNPQALYSMHIIAPIPDVRVHRPDAPAAMAEALTRALAKSADDRFRSAGALADALVSGQGRTSLRTSKATVVGDQPTSDVRLFQTSSRNVADPLAALAAAEDLGALRDAIDAALAAVAVARDEGDGGQVARLVNAIAARRSSPPALRRAAEDALASLATRPLVALLARGWSGSAQEVQATLESALSALMPAAQDQLLDLVRAERQAALVLLADRLGALTDHAAEALASDASPAVAALLVAALRESQRGAAVIERRLMTALRHPHPEVRRQALDAATQRGGVIAEHLGRQALSDRDADVREAAFTALGASGRREVVPDLAQVLEHGTEADQLGAVRALAALRRVEAEGPLRKAAQKRKLLGPSRVAEAAAAALASPAS